MEIEERARVRAESLSDKGLNGFDCVTVEVINQNSTRLDVHFFNGKTLTDILRKAKSTYNIEERAHELFPIIGGERIPAGVKKDQLKVKEIQESLTKHSLILMVEPTGDYSVYTLKVGDDINDKFDPLFSSVEFKMRPGCFNTICSKRLEIEEISDEPAINYMAKDFGSFKHLMISAMGNRIPGWVPTTEADLDMVLIELICAVADELSDYQDRIMNEAYFNTARKRISLARHARLMDYHIYQGNQASTWLAIIVQNKEYFFLPKRFEVCVKEDLDIPKRIIFSTKNIYFMRDLLNRLTLYTWSDTRTQLKARTTSADLRILIQDPNSINREDFVESNKKPHYIKIKNYLKCKYLTHILIQERKYLNDRRELEGLITKRQILKLDNSKVEYHKDPLTEQYYLRIHWKKTDELIQDYTISSDSGILTTISFHGNLAQVYHGEFKSICYLEPKRGRFLNSNEYFYERQKWGATCRLPFSPLSYEDVYNGDLPNGKYPPKSTCQVILQKEDGSEEEWEEQINFIHSDNNSQHFIVETDEKYQSLLRFGNGINGRELPKKSIIHCSFQVGLGNEGNIGADKLDEIMRDFQHEHIEYINKIDYCWNPLEVRNGRDPEPVDEILRSVPEAYRVEQYRAITVNDQVDDYEKRVQELEKVSKAHAKYIWMGSWRLVQLSIDPLGIFRKFEEFEELKRDIMFYVESVRLIGDKVIVKQAEYVPLDIRVKVCVNVDYWIDDVKDEIEAEFTDKFTLDGRMGFFHPDRWTFGQILRKSQLIGKIQSFKGVEYVIDTKKDPIIIRRWMYSERKEGSEKLTLQANEIIQVKNDWMQLEKGFMFITYIGGRR